IAVPAVLAVFNWPKGSDRYRRVGRFADGLFGKGEKFFGPPRHPKGRGGNLVAPAPRWRGRGAWAGRVYAVDGERGEGAGGARREQGRHGRHPERRAARGAVPRIHAVAGEATQRHAALDSSAGDERIPAQIRSGCVDPPGGDSKT